MNIIDKLIKDETKDIMLEISAMSLNNTDTKENIELLFKKYGNYDIQLKRSHYNYSKKNKMFVKNLGKFNQKLIMKRLFNKIIKGKCIDDAYLTLNQSLNISECINYLIIPSGYYKFKKTFKNLDKNLINEVNNLGRIVEWFGDRTLITEFYLDFYYKYLDLGKNEKNSIDKLFIDFLIKNSNLINTITVGMVSGLKQEEVINEVGYLVHSCSNFIESSYNRKLDKINTNLQTKDSLNILNTIKDNIKYEFEGGE